MFKNFIHFLTLPFLVLSFSNIKASEKFYLNYQPNTPLVQSIDIKEVMKMGGKEYEWYKNLVAYLTPYNDQTPPFFTFTLIEYEDQDEPKEAAKIRKHLLGVPLECVVTDNDIKVNSDNDEINKFIFKTEFDYEIYDLFIRFAWSMMGYELEEGRKGEIDFDERNTWVVKYHVKKVSSEWISIDFSFWNKNSNKEDPGHFVEAKFNRHNAFISKIIQTIKIREFNALKTITFESVLME